MHRGAAFIPQPAGTTSPLRNQHAAAIAPSTNRAELLRRTFAIDVLERPTCAGRMKLVTPDAVKADPQGKLDVVFGCVDRTVVDRAGSVQ